MSRETDVLRLDYSKAPPGSSYPRAYIGAHGKFHMIMLSGFECCGETIKEVKAAAWTHYKRHHDPPGMWSEWEADDKHFDPTGDGDWTIDREGPDGFRINAGHGRHASGGGPAFARAAAWAWYDRRHALAERDRALRPHLPESITGYLAMSDDDCKLAEAIIADDERRRRRQEASN